MLRTYPATYRVIHRYVYSENEISNLLKQWKEDKARLLEFKRKQNNKNQEEFTATNILQNNSNNSTKRIFSFPPEILRIIFKFHNQNFHDRLFCSTICKDWKTVIDYSLDWIDVENRKKRLFTVIPIAKSCFYLLRLNYPSLEAALRAENGRSFQLKAITVNELSCFPLSLTYTVEVMITKDVTEEKDPESLQKDNQTLITPAETRRRKGTAEGTNLLEWCSSSTSHLSIPEKEFLAKFYRDHLVALLKAYGEHWSYYEMSRPWIDSSFEKVHSFLYASSFAGIFFPVTAVTLWIALPLFSVPLAKDETYSKMGFFMLYLFLFEYLFLAVIIYIHQVLFSYKYPQFFDDYKIRNLTFHQEGIGVYLFLVLIVFLSLLYQRYYFPESIQLKGIAIMLWLSSFLLLALYRCRFPDKKRFHNGCHYQAQVWSRVCEWIFIGVMCSLICIGFTFIAQAVDHPSAASLVYQQIGVACFLPFVALPALLLIALGFYFTFYLFRDRNWPFALPCCLLYLASVTGLLYSSIELYQIGFVNEPSFTSASLMFLFVLLIVSFYQCFIFGLLIFAAMKDSFFTDT